MSKQRLLRRILAAVLPIAIVCGALFNGEHALFAAPSSKKSASVRRSAKQATRRTNIRKPSVKPRSAKAKAAAKKKATAAANARRKAAAKRRQAAKKNTAKAKGKASASRKKAAAKKTKSSKTSAKKKRNSKSAAGAKSGATTVPNELGLTDDAANNPVSFNDVVPTTVVASAAGAAAPAAASGAPSVAPSGASPGAPAAPSVTTQGGGLASPVTQPATQPGKPTTTTKATTTTKSPHSTKPTTTVAPTTKVTTATTKVTVAPTTAAPVTVAPTIPITVAPTTAAPVTVAPTIPATVVTVAPTTAAPVTVVPDSPVVVTGRTGNRSTNVIANASLTNPDGWSLAAGVFDPAVSRNAGSGSVRLGVGGGVVGPMVAVTPGKTYTLSFYTRSATLPSGNITVVPEVYAANGAFIRQIAVSASGFSNSAPGIWEESSVVITADSSMQFVRLKAIRYNPQASGSDMWVDDHYVGEGIGFENPTPKRPFNGSSVKVDSLGNMEVKENGAFKSFFPLCLAVDQNRANWSSLSAQGINCDVWGGHAPSLVLKAKAAGMYSGFQIAQYTNTGGWAYGQAAALAKQINDYKAQGLSDRILWYYWDNENSWTEWNNPKLITDTIKANDIDGNGQRMHPIFALQGNFGAARGYTSASGEPFTDVVGTYAPGGNQNTGGMPGAGSHIVLDKGQNQQSPGAICQLNHGIGTAFRTSLYACIAHGSRGMAFWADNVPSFGVPPVEQQPWWSDMPALRQEIDAMMPLIRQQHWTSWGFTGANSISPVTIGTRDLNGVGHLILANQTQVPQTVTLSLVGLPYQVGAVRDYFTGAVIGSVAGATITVTVPPSGVGSGTRVVKLSAT